MEVGSRGRLSARTGSSPTTLLLPKDHCEEDLEGAASTVFSIVFHIEAPNLLSLATTAGRKKERRLDDEHAAEEPKRLFDGFAWSCLAGVFNLRSTPGATHRGLLPLRQKRQETESKDFTSHSRNPAQSPLPHAATAGRRRTRGRAAAGEEKARGGSSQSTAGRHPRSLPRHQGRPRRGGGTTSRPTPERPYWRHGRPSTTTPPTGGQRRRGGPADDGSGPRNPTLTSRHRAKNRQDAKT